MAYPVTFATCGFSVRIEIDLINATTGISLVPFAMQRGKSCYFTADGIAALAYWTWMGYAVVGGDLIGTEGQFPSW
ncbi:hypothetical protein [Mycobacterium uberis]|uniref:hypothetical protein n=1 Tax=Mycobacterium uberis TaxID=2162698 RepID=UPI001FB1B50B|nr:hypothetical protein [Mycobacterium uberis]